MIPVRISSSSQKPTKSKFKNIRCTVDGIGFASKAESHFYVELKRRQALGEVAYFLRQVPIHLPGNIRHLIDFVEFWSDGTVRYVEVKGFDTPMGKLKRKQVEAIYPIKIHVVRKTSK